MSGPWFIPNSADAPLSWPADANNQMPGGVMGGCARYLPPPYNGRGYVLRTTQHREMTAADLGLSCPQKSDNSDARLPVADAPYSFWLGADTPRPDDFKASC